MPFRFCLALIKNQSTTVTQWIQSVEIYFTIWVIIYALLKLLIFKTPKVTSFIAHSLAYSLLFLNDSVDKANDFHIAKVQPRGVA